MGMAVTSGRFFNNKLYFVSGAPHANSSGQVYFFSREGSTGLLIPREELTLQGEDYGAGFGLSLGTVLLIASVSYVANFRYHVKYISELKPTRFHKICKILPHSYIK